MISSTFFLAAVLNAEAAEELTAPAPIDERRLGSGGYPILGGQGGIGPRWTWDNTMEKPLGTRDHGSYQTWYYTPEQQARLGVDGNGESTADFPLFATLPFALNDWEPDYPDYNGEDADPEDFAPIGGDWESQMPRWIRDPSFEKPAGTLNLGTSTIFVYTPEQQKRLSVDQYGEPATPEEDGSFDHPWLSFGRRRFGGRKIHRMGACQCSNGLNGMLTAHGCINCNPMPGQCQCPNGHWSGMLTASGCQCKHHHHPLGLCTCSNGSTGMLTADGCVNCAPMPGQCTCPNGSSGMLTADGCVNCAPMPGQCTCPNGSTGMLTAGGCVGCQEQPAGQCTCPNGSMGMLTANGCVNCGPMPGQCSCPGGEWGMLATDGECICDDVPRVFGR